MTIWNCLKGGTWTKEQWFPTVIKKVRLVVSRGNNIMKSGIETADSARLHISDTISRSSKKYVDPITWKNNPGIRYTLEASDGSFFTEGDTSAEDTEQADFFKYMETHHQNVFRISSVDRFEVIPHFEVFGK